MNTLLPNPIDQLSTLLGLPAAVVGVILTALAVWTLIWKGLGLWRAARNGQKWWFLAFLIINDLGILEIIYLLWFRKDKDAFVTRVATGSAAAPSDAP
ncbi:MAG TPA: DUF5652 family protein [Candidatus Paceibacterota bacterium]|nr:DUF5652 family protein [Candidatus Paceibacterota bacterium]